MQFFLTSVLMLVGATAAPDTLVICPPELQTALQPWLAHRASQGHVIDVLAPEDTAVRQSAAIRAAAKRGRLRTVMLVGDIPGVHSELSMSSGVPTGMVQAHINVRWGSDTHIATDSVYTDLDVDGLPDVAIGRIPVDSVDELGKVVRKIIRYEVAGVTSPPARRINVVAGSRGIGPAIDMLVETMARQFIVELVPHNYTVALTRHLTGNDNDRSKPKRLHVAREQLSSEGFAWVFAGHGSHSALDAVDTNSGSRYLLTVDDLTSYEIPTPDKANPLVVLLACYTGAFDGPHDCLAEELLVQPGGPIAVIAATRVSMPYGNTVFAYELLQSCFGSPASTLGETVLQAKRQLLSECQIDMRRKSLNQLARGLMPPPVDLSSERREHAQMYHLLGDPLLRLVRQKEREVANSRPAVADVPRPQRTK